MKRPPDDLSSGPTCYACAQTATRACPHCGQFCCNQHCVIVDYSGRVFCLQCGTRRDFSRKIAAALISIFIVAPMVIMIALYLVDRSR